MKRWMIFFNERSPLAPMLILSGVVCASTQYLSRHSLKWDAFALNTVFLATFLTLLRVMDEVKDVEKDKVIHPERPLARGLIPIGEARSFVKKTLVFLAALALVGEAISGVGSFLLLFTVLCGWLMYKEFYAGEMLSKNLFVFAVSHQLIALPLYLGVIAMGSESRGLDEIGWAYAWLALGCSFSYELCRKLNAEAHPHTRNYVQVHGVRATLVGIVVALGVILLNAKHLGMLSLFVPLVLAQLATLVLYVIRPKYHAVPAGLAFLTILGQVFGPALHAWWGWPT